MGMPPPNPSCLSLPPQIHRRIGVETLSGSLQNGIILSNLNKFVDYVKGRNINLSGMTLTVLTVCY